MSFILALLAQAASTTADWQITDQVSKLDGSVTYSAAMDSDELLSSILNQPKHAALVLGCVSGKATVALAWPDFIDYDATEQHALVKWKIDEGKIQTSSMFASTDLAELQGKTATEWMAAMAVGSKIVVSVPDKHGGQEATFALKGVGEIAAKIQSLGCGVAVSRGSLATVPLRTAPQAPASPQASLDAMKAALPDEQTIAEYAAAHQGLGIAVLPLPFGIMIVAVGSGSAAAKAGLKPGETIESVNGVSVKGFSADAMIQTLHADTPIVKIGVIGVGNVDVVRAHK